MNDLVERARRAYQAHPQLYEDLRFAVDRALRLLDRGREAFDADDLLRAAAEGTWVRFNEVYARLGVEAEELFPEFPWRAARRMRNLLVHRYSVVDYPRLWAGLDRFAELSWLLEERMGLAPPRQLTALQHPPEHPERH